MPRAIRNLRPLVLPPEPNAEVLPRYVTDAQCAEAHCRWFGPAGRRTIKDKWPLTWFISNGRAVTSSRDFLAEAQRRFDAAIASISRRSTSPAAAVDPRQLALPLPGPSEWSRSGPCSGVSQITDGGAPF
jgi:hypothetical protein